MAKKRAGKGRKAGVQGVFAELAELEKKQKYQEAIDLLHEIAARLRAEIPVA